jgi:integrase
LYIDDAKNGEKRGIPITDPTYDILKRRFDDEDRDEEKQWVFASNKKDKSFEFKKQWEGALKTSKLENFRFHDLRHSAASYLAMNGASLLDIQKILGHKSLEMVRRYAHLSKDHTAGTLAKMNKKVFGDE